ncbi:MAG: hypothetical protein DMG01_30450 [Acidobacteria bacterium]|nr:MAG: hypothetical protein DMG01_30450 [Acidobacteriota bacterium]
MRSRNSRVMNPRAGHTPLIYVPGPGLEARRAKILAPDGLVLGLKIDKGETFERLLQEDTILLHDGDLFVFFTDGISEAARRPGTPSTRCRRPRR